MLNLDVSLIISLDFILIILLREYKNDVQFQLNFKDEEKQT